MIRTARRAAAAGVSFAAVIGGLVAVAPAASAATPCQSDCISAITPAAYPDGLRLDVATTAGTHVAAEVWFGQTKVKSFAPAVDAAFTTAQTWEMKTGLAQGAWYRYVVKATDTSGNVRTEEGLLRTSKRDMTVKFDKVLMTNDSDDWSAADIYRIGTQAGPSKLGAMFGAQWTDGQTYSVPSSVRTHSVVGAKQSAPVKLYLIEDDNDGFGVGGVCIEGDPCLPDFTSGSDADADWATAAGALALPTKTGTSSGTFSISSPSGYRLRHTVTGTWVQHVRNVTTPVRSLKATAYNTAVRLTWDAPADLGGLSVQGYRITSSGGAVVDLPASTRSYDATGLTNGVKATYTVTARNAEGESLGVTASATPKAVPGAVQNLKATAGDAKVTATWAPSSLPSEGASQYRVYLNGVLKTTVAGTTATVAASNGTPAVVSVVPFNALGDGPATASASVTPYKPTSIGGWSTTELIQAAGTTISPTLSVSCGSTAGRPVYLQRRLQGGTSWVNYASAKTNLGCSVPVTIPVSVGIWEWRAFAPAWNGYGPATTAVRTIAAKTTISGWSTTTTTAATGWVLLDEVTVTPGNTRTVWVIARKAGTNDTFQNLWQGQASSNGVINARIDVRSGTWEYRVCAPPSYAHGEIFISAARIITGS